MVPNAPRLAPTVRSLAAIDRVRLNVTTEGEELDVIGLTEADIHKTLRRRRRQAALEGHGDRTLPRHHATPSPGPKGRSMCLIAVPRSSSRRSSRTLRICGAMHGIPYDSVGSR